MSSSLETLTSAINTIACIANNNFSYILDTLYWNDTRLAALEYENSILRHRIEILENNFQIVLENNFQKSNII